MVAVGVGRYPRLLDHVALPEPKSTQVLAGMQLHATADDARGIASAFAAMAGPEGAYAAAHVRTLTDEPGAPLGPAQIRAALSELARMKPGDVAVVSLAGHGFKPSEAEDMMFVTSGAELRSDGLALTAESAARDGLRWDDIAGALAGAKGRVLVLLDACHSGHITQDVVVPNEALADALARQEKAGLVVFAAAKGRQASLEPGGERALRLDAAVRASVDGARHGFFTGALLSALADPLTDRNDDGALQLSEVVDEVTRRVTRAAHAAGEDQTPWVSRRDMFGDFKLADAPRAAPP